MREFFQPSTRASSYQGSRAERALCQSAKRLPSMASNDLSAACGSLLSPYIGRRSISSITTALKRGVGLRTHAGEGAMVRRVEGERAGFGMRLDVRIEGEEDL